MAEADEAGKFSKALGAVGKAVGKVARKNVGSGSSDSAFPTFGKAAREERKAAREQRRAAAAQTGEARAEEGFFKKLLKTGGFLGSGAKNVAQKGVGSAGYVLVLLGLLHYFIKFAIGDSAIILAFSLVLFFFSGYALTNKLEIAPKTVFLPMITFILWYFFFGATIENALYLIIAMGLIFLAPLIFTKGKSFKAELYGFLPIVILFVDIGYLDFLLIEMNIPITTFTENLVLFMPWWFFLGLLTLPAEPSKSKIFNLILHLLRLLGVLWIVFAFVVPAIPDLGFETSTEVLPGFEELQEAREQVREQIPRGENTLWSNLACIGGGDYADLAACVEARQEESLLRATCEDDERVQDGFIDLEDCVQEERERQERELLRISGTNDPTLKESMILKWEKESEFFPQKTYRQENEENRVKYPLDLKIENPRGQEIEVEVSCNFNQKESTENTVILGRIVGEERFIVGEESVKKTIVCEPVTDLAGKYVINYTAKFSSLRTFARIQRVFIGDKTIEEKETLIPDILKAHFPERGVSKAPDDPVVFNFALGNPVENPIIENDNFLVASNVQVEGRGDLSKINHYRIHLEGFVVDDPRCLEDSNVDLVSRQIGREAVYLPTCIVTDIPGRLSNPGEQEYFLQEIVAELDYDYELTERVNVEQVILS